MKMSSGVCQTLQVPASSVSITTCRRLHYMQTGCVTVYSKDHLYVKMSLRHLNYSCGWSVVWRVLQTLVSYLWRQLWHPRLVQHLHKFISNNSKILLQECSLQSVCLSDACNVTQCDKNKEVMASVSTMKGQRNAFIFLIIFGNLISFVAEIRLILSQMTSCSYLLSWVFLCLRCFRLVK